MSRMKTDKLDSEPESYLDHTKPSNNGLILQNSSRQVTGTHLKVRMANWWRGWKWITTWTNLKTNPEHKNIIRNPTIKTKDHFSNLHSYCFVCSLTCAHHSKNEEDLERSHDMLQRELRTLVEIEGECGSVSCTWRMAKKVYSLMLKMCYRFVYE